MISVSNKNWGESKVNKNLIEKIKQENNFSDILAKLIIEKNFDTDEIYSIDNKITFTNVFQNNKDFRKSLVVLDEAITNKYKVCIIGDYDVDGSAATALLVKFFESINHPYFYYIPDRVKDGYGVSINLFKKLIQKKPKLVIMLDCASTAIKSIDYLNINKIKSIIIDHHEIATPYPKANAIINPKKDNGYKKYDYLCATALTYFFLDLLLKKFKNNLIIKDYLIYVY